MFCTTPHPQWNCWHSSPSPATLPATLPLPTHVPPKISEFSVQFHFTWVATHLAWKLYFTYCVVRIPKILSEKIVFKPIREFYEGPIAKIQSLVNFKYCGQKYLASQTRSFPIEDWDASRLLPPANEVVGRSCSQSCLSVCLSVHGEEGVPMWPLSMMHWTYRDHSGMFKLVQLGPHCTGTLPSGPEPIPGLTKTCSIRSSIYMDLPCILKIKCYCFC